MNTDRQLEILRQAATDTLPHRIDSTSSVPVLIVRELVSSTYLEAIDTSSVDGPSFMNVRITTSGREYLRVLEERVRAASFLGKVADHFPAVLKWAFGIIAALIVAYFAKQFIA